MESIWWPKVVIVILNWNQAEDTLDCLYSLQQIDYPNYEIVVVDNHSTDQSIDLIRSRFPQVSILIQGENLGCAGGRNVGVKFGLSRNAEYILFLDNDTEVDGGFLNNLISAAKGNSICAIFGPKIYYTEEPLRIWSAGGLIDWKTGETTSIGNGELDSPGYSDSRDVDFIAGCAMLVRSELFNLVGLFDEDYFIYFEETDWCCRARRAGYKCMFVPNSRVWHKESKSLGGASSPGKTYYLTRNQFLFIQRNLEKKYIFMAIARFFFQVFHYSVADILHGNIKHARVRLLGVYDFFSKRTGKKVF